jgi:hypothetical protein
MAPSQGLTPPQGAPLILTPRQKAGQEPERALISRLEQHLQQAKERAVAVQAQKTREYNAKRLAIVQQATLARQQLEQLDSQMAIDQTAAHTETDLAPKDTYEIKQGPEFNTPSPQAMGHGSPQLEMAHDTKYEIGNVKPYTQEEWDLVLNSGILGDDEILAVTNSPMNKHLVTGVEFTPQSRLSLSPGPRHTEPDPTEAIHTNALLLHGSGGSVSATETMDAEGTMPEALAEAPEMDYARPSTTGTLFDPKSRGPIAVQTTQGIKHLPSTIAQSTAMPSPVELVKKKGLNGFDDMHRQMEHFPPLPFQPGGKLPDLQKARQRQIEMGWTQMETQELMGDLKVDISPPLNKGQPPLHSKIEPFDLHGSNRWNQFNTWQPQLLAALKLDRVHE